MVTKAESGNADISEALESATSDSSTIAELKEKCIVSKTEIESLSGLTIRLKGEVQEREKLLTTLQSNLENYSDKLQQLHKTNEDQFKSAYSTINNLLRSATSTKLARSFDTRRRTYKVPRIAWASTGILSIIGIVLIALFTGGNIAKIANWSDFGLAIARKLPLVAPMAFSAYYAFHQYGILSRIEEEYAHKMVISWAFEGYRNTILETSEDGENIKKLIDNTLEAISLQSARIYDTKSRPVTPLDGSSEKIIDAVKDFASTQKTSSPSDTKTIAVTSLISVLAVSLIYAATKLLNK